ncbi:hypothetical protein JHU38_09835 [Prevotella sp. A2931]|uniref:Uncharacterized protein n=1 Tax=Prevotella illustrans TaxID=2800387 RepID=A0ABS3M7C4_9BACT|nr:hypothetical protein [Prevotella sp. oral taxon 820]MBO1364065.1 hypothetical protein [Prevotella illustrans]PTL25649.1 hypothetical protein C3V39_00300 [Prevotella sp. oral taxon 820]
MFGIKVNRWIGAISNNWSSRKEDEQSREGDNDLMAYYQIVKVEALKRAESNARNSALTTIQKVSANTNNAIYII